MVIVLSLPLSFFDNSIVTTYKKRGGGVDSNFGSPYKGDQAMSLCQTKTKIQQLDVTMHICSSR